MTKYLYDMTKYRHASHSKLEDRAYKWIFHYDMRRFLLQHPYEAMTVV